MILGEAIGTEYLDGDLLDEQIEEQKKTCRHYEDVLDHLYHLSRVPFFDYYLEPLIESNRKLLKLSKEILDRLKEKLERLYDIGNSTRFLFDNASDWLSAVSSAIEDLQVTITGEGNLSNGSWKGLLIPSFEEKVGRLENFKGGNEWNAFTTKEKINQLKDMIEETTEALPKERREWIENEIRKIIPNLTPEEREGFKTAMKEHGLKYDEIGLAWNELTIEGRFRRLKRMIERTTETMPKERKERIEGKIKELLPSLSDDEKKELKAVMKAHGLEYDEGGSEMGQFIGCLSFGAGGIIDDGTGGFFMLYDGPTLSSEGEQYFFSDLYKQYGVEPYGSLQSFGGSGSVLNKQNEAITYGNQALDPKKGTLEYGGIERYAIAIGPKLQNPSCDLSKKLDAKEMAYGTCVDISIELDGKTYYIPAIITDVKAHSAPTGVFQTGVPFDGSENASTGESGPIVEWYVIRGKGDADKTTGLNQFNSNASIIIYREEVLE